MFITYPDVDNLSACGVGAGWQLQASVRECAARE